MKRKLTLAVIISLLSSGLIAQEAVSVTLPDNPLREEVVRLATKVRPSYRQLDYQQREMLGFIHIGMNTFTGAEWGTGKEDPSLFNPSQLDADKWVKTFKDAGISGVILVAKHHDGFCVWPSKYTSHTVANSPWRNGKGDLVKEVADACRKYDMKLCLYLSPWDMHEKTYGTEAYNDYYIHQLEELLTGYGPVYLLWFDGAGTTNDVSGVEMPFDWERIFRKARELQPDVLLSGNAPDIRWVGNEKGLGRETEWSATVLTPAIYARSGENNKRLGVFSKAEDLGSRAMLEKATELFWYPSEVDVSIRPGWFYHAEEDSKVKSLKHLADIYFQSVGYNSVLLLNIPPDRRGLINEADVQRLNEFAAYREKIFTNNRVEKGRKDWEAVSGSETVYSLKPESEINVVMLQEDITKGQRVESFTVEALTEQGWQEVAKGTTVGYKRMVRFPAVKATQLRVKINECRLTAHISQVAAYYADPLEEENRTENWNNLPRASWKQVAASPLTIDLGKEVEISAFTYAPLKAEAKPTMAFRYKFYVSADGKNWKEVPANGEFSNIMHNPLPQTVTFGQKEKARFIKLEATTPTATTAQVEMNEIGVTVAP